ncbi:alpha-amylase family glycosyl hydrolase [Lacrimispora sp.]|uniref:alpha-amylase family glycosyl hydrolase n=1 Tax=Lacrimispora sp. TaxID=2719234 RepID=UPI002FD8EF1C
MSKWYEGGVFYHIYPLGLVGAPKENREDTVSGHFEELEQWIPHIRSLGCNAIYIGPLFESSTHGYDTRDYRMVDRRLGSQEGFQKFTALCHEAGIKVVVDGVFNHTGRDFFAFQDIVKNREQSPYKDWYKGIGFGGSSPLGDSFGYEAWQGHYELPCLNLYNPMVKQYLFDTIQFWIRTFDIDGIRLDCANVLDFGFMKELRDETSRMKEDFWLMGEVIHGDYGRWANDSMLHSVTNYELHKSIYSGHNDHNYFEIAHNVKRLDPLGLQLYTFVDNHDEDRIASKLQDQSHLYPVYTLLFTLPGIPSVYYGSEFGIEGKRTNWDDSALRPAISISDREAKTNSLSGLIGRLGQIHKENPHFHGGRYQELLLTNRQYAFARFYEGQALVTAVNNDDKEAFVQIACPSQGDIAVDLLSGEQYPVRDQKIQLTIPANRGVILKIMEG